MVSSGSKSAHTALPLLAPRGKPKATHLKWYESWIIRAALVATLTLGIGYAVSAYFTFVSIRAIATLAHDPAIEKALGNYLDHLKTSHLLRNALLSEKIRPRLAAAQKDNTEITGEIVRMWLDQAELSTIVDLSQVTVETIGARSPRSAGIPQLAQNKATSPSSLKPADPGLDWAWVDRDHLRLGPIVVTFPRGPDYEAFKATEDLKKRYQMVGVRLDEEIRPALMRASSVTLVITFVVLIILLIIMAQRVKARLTTVTEGFSLWSEQNAGFRFHSHYRGELGLITEQFNRMADEVEANKKRSLYLEKIASWQVIARKLAHEIKNPLTPIQMMVGQLKRRYKGDDQAFATLLDEAQSIITEEIQGLRRMVDDFAQFAKLPEPRLKDTDLVQLCRRAIDLQKNTYPKHSMKFLWQPAKPAADLVAKVDDDLLRQVLINLIKNAAEASRDQPATITVELQDGGHEFAIKVTDNGPGIPQENLMRIFEAYFTTKHTGPTPGMGLGLAVCQKIVLDHKGNIHVASQPGATVFTVRIPRVPLL